MKMLEKILNSAKRFAGIGLLIGGVAFASLTGCNLFMQPYPNPKTKIAFMEYSSPENINIWMVNSDGSDLKKVSQIEGMYNRRIEFSPNGEYLTFKEDDAENNYFTDNRKHKIIDLEGNLVSEFDGGERSDEDFTWTPDGSSILYGVYTDGIYRYDLNTNLTQKILDTVGYTYDHNPVMSPDLKKIVFAHHEYESNYYIKTMDADGTNLELIAEGGGTSYDEQLGLSWLDNEHIVWKNGNKDKLYYCDIKTKEVKEIPRRSISYIELSPDKKTLAIIDGDSGAALLDTAMLESGKTDFKIYSGGYGYCFAWSPDSNYFVRFADSSKTLRIYDKNGVEYKFMENPSEDFNYAFDLAWSSKVLQ